MFSPQGGPSDGAAAPGGARQAPHHQAGFVGLGDRLPTSQASRHHIPMFDTCFFSELLDLERLPAPGSPPLIVESEQDRQMLAQVRPTRGAFVAHGAPRLVVSH